MLDVNSHQSGAAQEQWFSVEQVDYQQSNDTVVNFMQQSFFFSGKKIVKANCQLFAKVDIARRKKKGDKEK